MAGLASVFLLFTQLFNDVGIIFRLVGQSAGGAILDSVVARTIVAAAVRHRIEGTVAEQAVKGGGVRHLVTGKIFAVAVLKKGSTVFHRIHLVEIV